MQLKEKIESRTLKSHSHLSKKKKNIICFNDSHSKMMKNVFYFMLKALFVLKIFKFLSWLFEHVEKTAWLERYDQFRNLWCHNLVKNELQYTYKQTMKFGQLIEYPKKNIFL